MGAFVAGAVVAVPLPQRRRLVVRRADWHAGFCHDLPRLLHAYQVAVEPSWAAMDSRLAVRSVGWMNGMQFANQLQYKAVRHTLSSNREAMLRAPHELANSQALPTLLRQPPPSTSAMAMFHMSLSPL